MVGCPQWMSDLFLCTILCITLHIQKTGDKSVTFEVLKFQHSNNLFATRYAAKT